MEMAHRSSVLVELKESVRFPRNNATCTLCYGSMLFSSYFHLLFPLNAAQHFKFENTSNDLKWGCPRVQTPGPSG